MHRGSLTEAKFTISQGSTNIIASSVPSSATSISVLGGGTHVFEGNFGSTPFSIAGTSNVAFSSAVVSSVSVGSGTVDVSSSTIGSLSVQGGVATLRNTSTVTAGLSVLTGTLNVQAGVVLNNVVLNANTGGVVVMNQASATNNKWNLAGASVTITGTSFSGGSINAMIGTATLNGNFIDTVLNVNQSATVTIGTTSSFSGSTSLSCSDATCDIRTASLLPLLTVKGSATVSGSFSTVSIQMNKTTHIDL